MMPVYMQFPLKKQTLRNTYKIPTPSWDVVQYALNKKLTYSIAEKCNIPYPKTAYPENLDAVIAMSEINRLSRYS